VTTGDSVPAEGLLGITANHQAYADSFVISYFLRCIGRANGGMLWVIWRSFIMFPLGWASKMCEHVFVGYGKDRDLEATVRGCQNLLKRGFESVVFFPEGSVKRPSTQRKSREYTQNNGLPDYHHVLCPKTGAFCVITEALKAQGCTEYVDITIGFSDASAVGRVWNANPLDLWAIFAVAPEPQEVHFHVQRIPIAQIGESEEAQRAWLFAQFEVKDRLLDNFHRNGHFPGPSHTFVPGAVPLLCDLCVWLAALAALALAARSLAPSLNGY